MNIVRCLQTPKGEGAQKRKTAVFRVKYRTSIEKTLLQSEVTTVSRNVL